MNLYLPAASSKQDLATKLHSSIKYENGEFQLEFILKAVKGAEICKEVFLINLNADLKKIMLDNTPLFWKWKC